MTSGNHAPRSLERSGPAGKKDPRRQESRIQGANLQRKVSPHRAEKMADGEAPEKVRSANYVRWKECAKIPKVEKKILKRHCEYCEL